MLAAPLLTSRNCCLIFAFSLALFLWNSSSTLQSDKWTSSVIILKTSWHRNIRNTSRKEMRSLQKESLIIMSLTQMHHKKKGQWYRPPHGLQLGSSLLLLQVCLFGQLLSDSSPLELSHRGLEGEPLSSAGVWSALKQWKWIYSFGYIQRVKTTFVLFYSLISEFIF